ncbi:T9SS type A sorting domain-containing protein [Lewinella sp. 4G2]|uniref:T9SS type A sorting domain-containing protein n=1 Tax=Lewinella sp. 4G2 TaxID=1803372 RepID=UPI0007B46EED|nr:T9SS type A sorting domain-containing protein [Lewinella sp. 4G2]OAV44385.1 hypothetical protein A3850_007695 [Lewinella sp. 4G2]
MNKFYFVLLPLLVVFSAGGLTAQCAAPSLGSSATEDQRFATLRPTRIAGATGYRVVLSADAFRDPIISPDTTYEFGPDEQIILYGLEPATRYRVNIQAICGAEVSSFSNRLIFTTEDDGPPLLDDRDGGFNYFVSASTRYNPVPGTTLAATNQGNPAGPCGGDADDDVWYSFSPIWPKYTFTVDPVSGTDSALVVEIYDERQDTLVACRAGLPGETVNITLENIPVNQDPQNRFEYDLRVYTAGTNGYAVFEIGAAGEILPVADETGCIAAESITLDGTGQANAFVDVLNQEGEVIVSIENTQPLGVVDVSYFEDAAGARLFGPNDLPYLGRNISINPTVQPAGPVRVRSYLTQAAVDAFLMENNIASVSELGVTKVATGDCSAEYTGGGVIASFEDAGRYGSGYYVDVVVTSFSEFFFSAADRALGEASSTRSTTNLTDMRTAPNPFTHSFKVDFYARSGGELRISLHDVAGKRVQQRTERVAAGLNQINVEGLGDLPKGTYFLRLIDADGGVVVRRVLKQ